MAEFYYNNIKPEGWLKDQLRIQAEGLSGNLDKVWPDVKDSAWFKGNRDGWERAPYWLDGFIPLAFLLDDAELISRAKKYIGMIVSSQDEDGWLCPGKKESRTGYDVWAFFLIGKVLAQYAEYTEDKDTLECLYRGMKCLYGCFADKTMNLDMFRWGKMRWFEAFIPLQLLYDRYGEGWITEFARILEEQGADYNEYRELWIRPLNEWKLETHIVNIAMMFKFEAVTARLFNRRISGQAEKLWRFLDKYNGTATGCFTGDETLAGLANNQGTELCSVAELMYSCEIIYAITGKAVWADRLEKLAFNALPATFTDDMWAHQYDQMVNQIECTRFRGKPIFRNNIADAHIFGLEPNYGCCTANFSQGWPKLAASIYLKRENGIHCALMLPSVLDTKINGVAVKIRIDTEYPFRMTGRYTVITEKPVNFELSVRIPHWAEEYTVNGERRQDGTFAVKREWNGTYTFDIELSAKPVMKTRPYGLKTAEYGPIVFALPLNAEYRMLEYTKNNVERKFPYCDYELVSHDEWRYGYSGSDFEVCLLDGDGIPFSSKNPRIALKTRLCRVNWDFADGYDNVSDKKPVSSRAISAPEEKTLIPYGCAKLRMTEMPLAKIK